MLVTHEHLHDGVGAIGGQPVALRSTAGRLDSPIGEVVAVAAARLRARVIVPTRHRSARIDFLEPVDAFVASAAHVERLASPAFDLDALPAVDGSLVVVPVAPRRDPR